MTDTVYRCPICWGKAYPDGCAFHCSNKKHLRNNGVPNWIDPKWVFNMAWGSYGAEQLRWNKDD